MILYKRSAVYMLVAAFMVILSMSFSLVHAQVMTNYYVSISGSDENPGTEEQPFQTIQKARDVIRTSPGIWTGDICVWIRGGIYALTGTLEFTELDSGKDGYNVIYKAYEGERPVITGGTRITGWTIHSGNIYKAECPEVVTLFRQLYVNGKRAVRARTPNVDNYNRLYQWRVSDKTVRVHSTDLNENWQNISNGKVEIIIQQYWAESIIRILSVTQNGSYKDIAPNPTERDIVFGREWPQKSPEQAYHFENSLDFVDQGGEWYLDDNSTPRCLYYMPREGENIMTDTIIAPTVETLISIKGSAPGTNVKNLVFEGVIFEHSNWTRPSLEGNIGLQQQQYSIGNDQCERPEAGVFIQNADHITFTRNILRNMGSTGLDIYTGTNNIIINGNVFHSIAGNGIQAGKFTEQGTAIAAPYNPADAREYCEHITISNNYIFKVAQDYYCGTGIAAGYVRYTNIVHNEIAHLPYIGISVGWGWTTNPNPMTNNSISYNRIYDVMNLLCDGAGIYTLGNSPNSVMRYNFINGVVKSTWATTSYTITYPLACIYLDQGTQGYKLDQNVLRDAHNNNYIHRHMDGNNIMGTNYRNETNIEANAGIEPEFLDIKNNNGGFVSLRQLPYTNTYCRVYPTFVRDELYLDVDLSFQSPLDVYIYNTFGNKVKQVGFKNIPAGKSLLIVNVGDLNKGSYIYLIQADEWSEKGKIMVL